MEKEINFVIEKAPQGGFSAKAEKANLSTMGTTLEELKLNAWNEVICKYEGKTIPSIVFSGN